jgi:gamma-glutamyltranspeptidase / glutathione hydrolase
VGARAVRPASAVRPLLLVMVAVLLLTACAVLAPDPHPPPGSAFDEGASGRRGVVATESPAATAAALEVLDDGGNAVDAAVAAVLAVGVARPQSCGLGGGGFLLHRAADGTVAALDFRETAPAAFRADSLLGPGLHRQQQGHLVVGVPGTAAGLAAAHERLGALPWPRLVAPAERLARDGVEVRPPLAAAIRRSAAAFRRFPAGAAQYLPDGRAPEAGAVLVQPDLAATLALLAEDGPAAFYRGPIAERIVASTAAADEDAGDRGLLTAEDLAAYRPVWRDPIVGTYRGHEVLGMPPPSSGGIAVQQMLGILERFDLVDARRQGDGTEQHLLAEAQRLAFADRAAHLADPDVVEVPTAALLDPRYLAGRADRIDPAAAGDHGPGDLPGRPRAAAADAGPEGSTTHVSVIDATGAVAALTCTVESSFGSGVVVPGTGVVLNNQLTDFSAPGTANEPGPGKRPRSSMSPTIVVRDGVPVLAHGGAGGARIIMGALLPIIEVVDHGRTIAEALDAPRLEATGGAVEVEGDRLGTTVLEGLRDRGHVVRDLGDYAPLPRVQAVGIAPRSGLRSAVADPRTDRAAAAQP